MDDNSTQESLTSVTEMPKRGPLESLAREELIKKCKGLLGLAQKAKLAKDEFMAENVKLSAKIYEYETQKEADKKSIMTMKEMVDVLTENKLTLTSQLSDLQLKLDKSEIKIRDIQETQTQYMDYSIENEALKRQVKRLENENDELLQDLQNMEEKLHQVNEIGKIQKQDLEELEQQTNKWNNMEKDLIILEKENNELKNQIEEFSGLEKSNKNLNELKKTLDSKLGEVKRLRERENKYIEKIQYLKDKLALIAMKLQKLKKCKEILLQTQKDYSDSIAKWQIDITHASRKLMDYIKLLENEKLKLRKEINIGNKDEELPTIHSLNYYEERIGEILNCFENVEITADDNANMNNKLKQNVEQLNSLHSELMLENGNLKEKILSYENKFEQQILKMDEFNLFEKSLKQELGDLKEGLKCSDKERELLHIKLENKDQAISRMQFENTDLLSEMRELNEALKARGDVISRQQDKISELENEINRYNQNQVKKHYTTNSNLDTSTAFFQLTDQSFSSQNDSDSITSKNLDNQSEVLSVSSMSHIEQVQRLKDVEENYEDKYNKVRILAVKLKKKVQEQLLVITSLENNLSDNSNNNKNLLALQKDNDNLVDDIDQLKKEISSKDLEIKTLAEMIHELKGTISQLEINLINEKKIVLSKDTDIREFQSQLKLMKQEKDTFNVIRKQIEKERDDFKAENLNKDKEKQKLSEKLEKSKKELEKLKIAGHQSNVLSLEVEAYEKSLNDVSQKLELLKVKNKEQNEEIESREESITSLKKEIKILEESNESEKQHSQELKQQIDLQQAKLKQIDFDKQELLTKLSDSEQENELLKSKLDEMKIDLSNLVIDKDKLISQLQLEANSLKSELRNLNEKYQDQYTTLKNSQQQFEDIQAEFTSYKVRAQSVLRQNQSKETSRERELEEELTALTIGTDSLNLKLKKSLEQNELHEKKMNELHIENESYQKRCKELIQLVDELRSQNDGIMDDNRKQIQEYQESLKSNRLQIDTLNNCYKTQIEELEQKHTKEIEELKKIKNEYNRATSRLGPFGGAAPKSSDEQKIDLILMEREDAEGSEASYSVNKRKISTSSRSRHEMIPLDELLNTNFDENAVVFIDDISISPDIELKIVNDKLQAEKIRTKHLTTLLADVEQDLVKRTQMNELLKEELRRIERSIDREEHIKNSEYLKNIVFKFITLNNTDEKERLVPVLTTILKLSPEETHKIQNAAKGIENSNRSWGNYIPLWPNNQ